MRLPADDPLLRLRAAVKRKAAGKPLPAKERKPTKPKVFRRSQFCKVGCTKHEDACWKCRSYERWRRHRGMVD